MSVNGDNQYFETIFEIIFAKIFQKFLLSLIWLVDYLDALLPQFNSY